LAGLLGGVALFLWGALSHLVLGIGDMGFSNPPPDKEPALIASLQQALPASGLYYLPGLEGMSKATAAQKEAHQQKCMTGPRAMLIYHAEGADLAGRMPKQLLAQFAACVGGGLIAAFLLASAGGLSGFLPRVYFCALLGLGAWLATDASYWIWYEFPLQFEIGALIERVVGFTCAGVVIALVLPKRA
jgi:hypothetical protein